MRYFIFPVKDTTIYEEFPNKNSGVDEILEIGTTNEGRYAVRSLMQFEIPSDIPNNAKFDLVGFVADAEKLTAEHGIEVVRLGQAWSEGTGYFYQDSVNSTDGATWSQSLAGTTWNTPGGFISGSHITGSISFTDGSVTVDITDFITDWVANADNNGILVKTIPESGTVANVKLFSRQTHTIYRPALVAKWDDQVYVTGSSPWPTTEMKVTARVNPSYRVGELVRVTVSVREKYPQKTFDTVMTRYSGERYLPATSYYSIIDELSGTTIIPFSEESKISTTGDVNYFMFHIQQMYPLRYYRVLIKVVHDGVEEIFDNNSLFLVN